MAQCVCNQCREAFQLSFATFQNVGFYGAKTHQWVQSHGGFRCSNCTAMHCANCHTDLQHESYPTGTNYCLECAIEAVENS